MVNESTNLERFEAYVLSLNRPNDPQIAVLVGLARGAAAGMDAAPSNASLLYRYTQLLDRIAELDGGSGANDMLASLRAAGAKRAG